MVGRFAQSPCQHRHPTLRSTPQRIACASMGGGTGALTWKATVATRITTLMATGAGWRTEAARAPGGATAKTGSDLLTMRVLGWTKEKRMLQLTLSEASGSRSLASSQVEHRGPPLAVQGSRWPAANLYQQVMLGYVRYKPKLSYCSSSSGYHCYKYRLKF